MITIIKYNAGNIGSIKNVLDQLGCESIVSDDTSEILKADKVIFPGVGEASSAMKYLKEKELDKTILSLTQPMLGICLGLQLMCKSTEEGRTECLGIFENTVRKFPPKKKVPHIGWNNFSSTNGTLFHNINNEDDVYYVHSYYANLSKQTIATCNYIQTFSAAIQHKNFYATQFHPEKSAKIGFKILKNFLQL